MNGFCGLYHHRLGLVVLVSLAIMACAAVTLWVLRKPETPIHSFLYHVFNYRARFVTSDPEALKRFDDKAVQASVAVAAAVALFNIVSYWRDPGAGSMGHERAGPCFGAPGRARRRAA